MWYRVVRVCDASSDWQPIWALRIDGDGPYIRHQESGAIIDFESIRDAVYWVRDHRPGTFVEIPAVIEYP